MKEIKSILFSILFLFAFLSLTSGSEKKFIAVNFYAEDENFKGLNEYFFCAEEVT